MSDSSPSTSLRLSQDQVDYLLSPKAIRDRARAIFDFTQAGLGSFEIHEERFQPTVKFVMDVIEKKYPDRNIPFHSRWGHFRAGNIDRPAAFKKVTASLDPIERARTELDLVITSVLLDAGAGAAWSFHESSPAGTYARSEGLGVASYHMFLDGSMSFDRKSHRADSVGLKGVTSNDLNDYFQVSENNPLVGVAGRVALLNGLGRAVEDKTRFKDGRPGNIVDYLIAKHGQKIPATSILRAVLDGFGAIWPGRLSSTGAYGTVNLGDMWRHSKLAAQDSIESLVPIHKLSQWMTYSLIEPMLDAGLEVTGVSELTGLAEYRNGGLLLDMGVLTLRSSSDAAKSWGPESDLIIEWRALTVYFLDRIGAEVQKALGKTPEEFPLAKVLEGGTWWAGRFIAKEKRPNADPPLNIASDGTVF
jgi:hypothetical protein